MASQTLQQVPVKPTGNDHPSLIPGTEGMNVDLDAWPGSETSKHKLIESAGPAHSLASVGCI